MFRFRMLGVHHHEPVHGCAHVRAHVEAPFPKADGEVSGNVNDQRTDLATPFEILDVEVVARPPMLHTEDAIAAVTDRVHAQETRRPNALAEDFRIVVPRGTKDVMSYARPGLARAVRVVKALAFVVEIDARVQGSWEPFRQVCKDIEIQKPDFDLVRAADPDRIHHGVAVRREVHDREERAIPGVEILRIEHHFVFAAQIGIVGIFLLGHWPTIDHGSLLTLPAHGEVLVFP